MSYENSDPPVRRVQQFVIQVHFHDEREPSYVWTTGSADSHTGTGSLAGATKFAYPGSPDAVKKCAALLRDAETQWGREAVVAQVLVDVTDLYLEKLKNAEAQVLELRRVLGMSI